MNSVVGFFKLLKYHVNPFGKFNQLDKFDDKTLQSITREFPNTYISIYCVHLMYRRNGKIN